MKHTLEALSKFKMEVHSVSEITDEELSKLTKKLTESISEKIPDLIKELRFEVTKDVLEEFEKQLDALWATDDAFKWDILKKYLSCKRVF